MYESAIITSVLYVDCRPEGIVRYVVHNNTRKRKEGMEGRNGDKDCKKGTALNEAILVQQQ